MATPSSASASRIPTSRSREHILSESSTGWGPLRIAKRPGLASHPSASSSTHSTDVLEDRPRRTSNSYKHLKSNSLVSNSPFKQEASPRAKNNGSFSDGESQSPSRAASVGLGIGLGFGPANGVRRAGQTGAVVVRKSSKDGSERRYSGSGGTENEDVKPRDDDSSDDESASTVARQDNFRRRTKGRQSAGLANLGKKAKVTNSPFLALSPPSTEAALPMPALSPSAEDTTPSLSEADSFPSPPPSSADDVVSTSSPPRLRPTPEFEPISLPLCAPLTPTKPASNLPPHIVPEAPPTPSPKSSLKSHPRTSRAFVRERRKTVTFEARPEISVFEREGSADLSSAVDSDDDYGDPYPRPHPPRAPAQEEEYSYELSPKPQQGSDDDEAANGSFEFDLTPSPLLALQRSPGQDSVDDAFDSHVGNLSLGSYSSDYSLNDLDLRAGDDEDPEDFVNRLLAENQLLSPVPATQTVFERYSADSEEVFGSSQSLGLSSAETESSGPSPALAHLDLPHLPASQADPILMNGNVLEPSTNFRRSTSSKSNLAEKALSPSKSYPEPHAHQTGPLPDPFLTVNTVQGILGSPGNGPRDEEDGVPLGRTHHSDRRRTVGELREGLGLHKSPEQRRSDVHDSVKDGEDVFGEKLDVVDSPMKPPPASHAHSLAPLNTYSLPSLTSQSPLFNDFDLPSNQPSTSEFGAGFQYKPSSSLERLQQESKGSVGSVGSSGGRSPRLTKESIRRRMEMKAAAAASSKQDGAPRGLGFGLPETVVENMSALDTGSPTKKDKPLPPPPSVERPARPTIATDSRTLSAEEILSTESALGRLAGQPSTSPVVMEEKDLTLKTGHGRDVQISPVSQLPAPASSTPVEEAPSASLSRAEIDARLMPPPPIPRSMSSTSNSKTARSTSPTPSQQSDSSNDGPSGRADAIIARKREKRAEVASSLGIPNERRRPRRSMSQGDVADEQETKRHTLHTDTKRMETKMGRLSIGPAARNSADFANGMDKEFERIGEKSHKYRVIQHDKVYVASDEKVSHGGRAGDLDQGRAWRSVKRASDMNEYAEEIRELRSREKPGRAHAKVFVKIVGSDFTIPLQSDSQASFRIALNNGLHSVETSAYPLRSKVDIGQEFELLGLENLEFSLAIKVKKDHHIASRLKALNPPPEPPTTPSKQSGFRKLMSGSPRRPKQSPSKVVEEPPRDELVRYLSQDGTLATVKIVFKDIATRCNGQLLSLHLPLAGKWNEDSIAASSRFANMDGVRRTKSIGKMELQVIMIPSLPGLTQNQLPQSLEDAVVGLRHVRWHKMDYYSGTLTQLGGGCSSWRRRRMRIVGGLLEATNDITGKITARIDLSKMRAIRDYNAEEQANDLDRPMSVERSFGLMFEDGEEIQFFADKDQDKVEWVSHLNELLGRVPSLPLWAEVLWVKQQQKATTPSRPT